MGAEVGQRRLVDASDVMLAEGMGRRRLRPGAAGQADGDRSTRFAAAKGPERVESAALDDDPAMPSARTMRITTAHGEDRAHVGSLRDDEAFAARQLNHTDGARHVEAV